MASNPFVITPNQGTTTQPQPTGNVLSVALSRVGVDRYCWGGTAPPCFDCSGFVYWCFNQVGIPLQRAMFSQLGQGQVVTMGPPGNRLMNAMPGDVVYFGLNNPNPAQNHEGIIVSTNGTGSMVQAECTACGPINIGAIGEGSSSEPISAIRRFGLGIGPSTPAAGGTGASGDSQATLLAANCTVNIPVIGLCLWRPGWSRAVLGATFMLAALALGLTGVVLLTGGKLIKGPQQVVPKPMDFERLNARLARTKPNDVTN